MTHRLPILRLLILSCLGLAAALPACAATLQVPTTHPRLWYGNPARLQRAKAFIAGNPISPVDTEVDLSGHYRDIALRSLLTEDLANPGITTGCDTAITWLKGFEFSDVDTAASDDARWYGEDAILVYDWCSPRINAADRAMLIARWNGYMTTLNNKPWGGLSMPHNNYFIGYLRNSLLWGIATMHENPSAQGFINHALDTRYRGKFVPWYDAFGVGGVTGEGTQYGAYMLGYLNVGLQTAADFGDDAWAVRPYFNEAMYYLTYSTSGMKTPPQEGGPATFDVFPFNDDEKFKRGGSAARTEYADLATSVIMRQPASRLARDARAWLAKTNAKPSWWMRSELASIAPVAATDLPLPLDYFAAGSQFLYGRRGRDAADTRLLFQMGGFGNSPDRGGVGHWHLDAGGFNLWRKGRWLSKETTGYSSPDDIVGWNNGPKVDPAEGVAHNTVLFEGRGQMSQFDDMPKLLRMQATNDFLFAAVDLAKVFRGRVTNPWDARDDWPFAEVAIRELLFLRELDAIVVVDRLQSGSDSLQAIYGDPGNRYDGPRMNAQQVHKTFVLHGTASPTLIAATPANNYPKASFAIGDQAMDLTTLLPQNAAHRVITEGGDSGQFRLEYDASGSADTYFINVIGLRDAAQGKLVASLEDLGTRWRITITGPLGKSATVVLTKGLASKDGSVQIGSNKPHPLGHAIEETLFLQTGPVWVRIKPKNEDTPMPKILPVADKVLPSAIKPARVEDSTSLPKAKRRTAGPAKSNPHEVPQQE